MASYKINNTYLNDHYLICGKEEREGNINNYNLSINDFYFGKKTFEEAEIKLQNTALNYILNKNNYIDLVIGGDLSNQLAITSYAHKNIGIPFLGIYNACSTFNEGLIILSLLISNKVIKKGLLTISSHNKTSEKQFRYPIEYGAPKKKMSTYTATGALSLIVSNKPSNIKIDAITIGKIIDYGINDVNNMGAVMAGGAVNTFINHLKELKREASYYDLILTGDLGKVGANIFKDIIKNKYKINLNNYLDAGSILYKRKQHLYSGASGPIVLPMVLFGNILPQNKYHKILLITTGSLHSSTLVNQGKDIPCISHAVSLEVI